MTLALTAIAAAVLLAAGYYVECAVFPWGKCLKCEGNGKKMSPAGKHWRPCRRCKGAGRRLRVGRRVWNFVQRRRQAGQ
ncbi:hypothetical protein ACGFI9_37130 [Micromonospora sp. NPDC048930]|uniref:hypothetical protein n=1 Tax=Micromonospora sp. NPDC048930 TaxID=3364261 RepID=UPI0037134E05